VVVSPGVGDLDAIIGEFACGVVVQPSPDSLDAAVARLDELVADPEMPARCRRAAETHFDLSAAVAALEELYRAIDR
jgi:glycosyltransferase involved in cell wall biosynthesis